MKLSKSLVLVLLAAGCAGQASAQSYAIRFNAPGVVAATPAAPAPIETAPAVPVSGGAWADGSLARSCLGYLQGDATHAPATADGVYTIKPAATTYSVTCDMSGGGWTRFDYMVAGTAGWPGNYSTVTTPRVQPVYLAMYQELASVSASQKIVGVSGNSEQANDFYEFRGLDDIIVAGTVKYSGPMTARTLTIDVNYSSQKALGYTWLRTDMSVYSGDGASLPAQSWFK